MTSKRIKLVYVYFALWNQSIIRTNLHNVILLSTLLLLCTPSLLQAQIDNSPSLAERAEELNRKADRFMEAGDSKKGIEALLDVIKMYEEAGTNICRNSYPLSAALRIGEIEAFKPIGIAQYRWMVNKCASNTAKQKLIEAEFIITLDAKIQSLYIEAEKLSRIIDRTGGTPELQLHRLHLWDKIIKEFPESKLTPYISYLVAKTLHWFIGNTTSPYDDDEAAKKAADAYRITVNRYPKAKFPFDSAYWQRGLMIAPYAQFALGDLLKSDYYHTPNFQQAIVEYQKIIKDFSDAKDSRGSKFITNAYIQLLHIYADWEEKGTYSDTDKAKQVATILLKDYQNEPFFVDGYFGKTHPEALLRLASVESNREKAEKLLFQVIERYGNESTGKDASDAVESYGYVARRLLNSIRDHN